MMKFHVKMLILDNNMHFYNFVSECRVESNHVVPSLYWVDTEEEKEILLNDYKNALRQQDCKYFNKVKKNGSYFKIVSKHLIFNAYMYFFRVKVLARLEINAFTNMQHQTVN